MHILVGVGVAVALLYFWLIGHWFARVLTFLLFGALFAFCLGALFRANTPESPEAGMFFGGLIGLALAWPLASLPIYYWRQELARSIAEAKREDERLTREVMAKFNARHGLIS